MLLRSREVVVGMVTRVWSVGVRWMKACVAVTCLAVLALPGCAGNETAEQASKLRQGVTCDNASIFGFEAVAQWTGTDATLSSNTRRIQGNAALGARGGAHMQVRSAATCSLGATYDLLSFYLAANSTSLPVSRVNVSVSLQSPSRGLPATLVGTQRVVVPAQGHFTRVELLLPSEIATKLAPAYSDLRITLTFEAEGSTTQDYLLDDFSLRTAAVAPIAGTGALQSQTLELKFPSTVEPLQLALLSQQRLAIADDARIQKVSGGFGTVAASGGVVTNIGVGTKTGAVVSVPSVELRNNATVMGDLSTSGSISCGTSTIQAGKITCNNGAIVTGQARTGAALTPLTTLSWRIEYQQSSTDVTLGSGQRSLEPGPYAGVTVRSGAKLTLSTGTYYFDSLTLDSNSQLTLINDRGPVVVYVRDSINWRGGFQTLGRPGDFLLVMRGTQPFAIETPFDGTLVAPRADVRMAVGSTAHAGAVFAKGVQIDPRVVFTSRPPLPLLAGTNGGSSGDKARCADTLASSPLGQSMTPRDLQAAILRYCGGSDLGPCELALMAQLNLDYFAAARQLIQGGMTPSNHMGFMLDRERKTVQFHGNETLACQIVNGDNDVDFVPNGRDACPNTPPLTATLHNGCTDTTANPAPPIEDILAGLPTVAVPTDPRCFGAPSPELASPFGAWRFPSNPSMGKALWVSKDPDTSGCPKWYILEGKLTDGSFQVVGFSPDEDTNLSWIQRADNILQFNIRTSDPAGRGAWASYDVFTNRYRVMVVNAAGRKSPWSDWFRPGEEGCAAGACSDF